MHTNRFGTVFTALPFVVCFKQHEENSSGLYVLLNMVMQMRVLRVCCGFLTFPSFWFLGKSQKGICTDPCGSQCAVKGIKQHCWHCYPHAALVLVGRMSIQNVWCLALITQAASSSHFVSLYFGCCINASTQCVCGTFTFTLWDILSWELT